MAGNKRRRWPWALGAGVVLAGLVQAETLVHGHPHFEIEKIHGFFPLLGAAAVVGLVLISRLVRGLFMRGEDYYDL